MIYLTKEPDLAEFIQLAAKHPTQMYEQQMNKYKHQYFACDFECTTLEPYTVYMVTIENIETKAQYLFSTIDEFLQFCEWKPNSTMYFHNGRSYDFEFIISRCFNRPDWNVQFGKQVTIKKQLPEVVITKRGTPSMRKGKVQFQYATIKLLDSLDVVQGSIKSLGESIGLKKGLGEIETPLVAKIYEDGTWLEQDTFIGNTFTKHHTQFHVDCIKRGWWQYAMQDTVILAEILRQYDVIEHAEKHQFTSAAIAYNEMIQANPVYEQMVNHQNELGKNKEYKQSMIRSNRMAKNAYKGGIAWANPLYTSFDFPFYTAQGYHLDYTSMYPSIYMNPTQYPLPMNMPTNHKTNLFIVHYKNLRCVCKEGCFPLLKSRTDDMNSENVSAYLKQFRGDISLTKPEWEYMKHCYEHIEYDSVQTVYYNEHVELEKALVTHGQKWYQVKETSGGAKRVISKMMLNTAYGYLGFFEKKIKTYDYQMIDGVVQPVLTGESITGKWNAELPAAAFITAYGRVKLANDINQIGIAQVVCCDTDSLFTVNKSLDELKRLVDIDDVKLGALKIEHVFKKIKAVKAKTWCIAGMDDVPIAQATAGSNYQFKDIKNFKPGQEFYSSVKVRGVGGVGIRQQRKQLGLDEPM